MRLLLEVYLLIFFHESLEFFLAVKFLFERDSEDLQVLIRRGSVKDGAVAAGL